MAKSLCKGKRVIPNKCKKLRGCKVARGTKRTFCRKTKNRRTKCNHKSCKQHNKTQKNKKKK